MAYQHNNKKGTTYYLHSKDVTLKGSNQRRTIYFFAKKPGQGAMDSLPSGFEVVENQRTGLPVLRKAK